jgi:hypothetical protein
MTGFLDGKLGKLAKEIAEEAAHDFNMDTDNMTDAQDVFKKIMQNPGKMMNLVKNVGDKLDQKMKSGDIKENELMEEATQMLGKMKDIPGLQDMLGKLGPGLFNQLSSPLKKTSTHKKEKQQQPQQPQQQQLYQKFA